MSLQAENACPCKSNQTKPDFGTLLLYILCATTEPQYAMPVKSNQTKSDFAALVLHILCARAPRKFVQLVQLSTTSP